LSVLLQEPKQEAGTPQVVRETPLLRLWHKADTTFSVPKAVVYLSFISPEAYTTPEAAVLTSLFTLLLTDYLNEVSYEAELAGLSFSVGNTAQGFLLSIRGCAIKTSNSLFFPLV
jgi:insulysin